MMVILDALENVINAGASGISAVSSTIAAGAMATTKFSEEYMLRSEFETTKQLIKAAKKVGMDVDEFQKLNATIHVKLLK
jgi:hypothetical protein